MAFNCCVCGICYSLQITKPAVVWCCDCDDGLCDDCNERHRVSKASQKHQTIPANKYQELSAQVFRFSQICTVHNDKYKIYCNIHDCFCCNRCVIEKHNSCKDLESIDDIVKNAKTSNKFIEMENSLSEMEKNMSKVFETVLSNKASIRRDKRVIEKIIHDTREEINIQLDEIQLMLIKELADLEEKENKKMDDFIIKLTTTEKAVKDYQKRLSNVKEYATEFQTFLAIEEFEKDIENDKHRFNLVCSNEAARELHLVFHLNKTLQNFQNDIKSFGHVSAEYISSNLLFDGKQYVQIRPDTSVNILFDLIGQFTISSKLITSCVLLPDRGAAFSYDCEGFLIAKPDGNKGFAITVKPYYVQDITFVPSSNSLAAPCNKTQKHCIRMVDLEKQKLTQRIAIDANYCGICYNYDMNSLFVIGCEGIQMITLQDQTVRTVKAQTLPGTPYITAFGDSIYYTINNDFKSLLKKYIAEGVYCCDLQGNFKWMFRDNNILKSPKGITVDNEGCVYVAGYHSNTVIRISSDGSHHTVLLSSRDGLEAPTGIDYNMSTNQLLVANQSGRAFLYNIKKP